VIPRRTSAQESHRAAIDRLGRIESWRALNLAAKPELGEFLGTADAGFGLTQTRQDFLRIVSDGRDDAHSGDDDPSHSRIFPKRWPRLKLMAYRLAGRANSARPSAGFKRRWAATPRPV
jgi:hypothetical protein